ncbi:hypothetical protein GCM10009677_33890 [Sphaerisporangium rubeum]
MASTEVVQEFPLLTEVESGNDDGRRVALPGTGPRPKEKGGGPERRCEPDKPAKQIETQDPDLVRSVVKPRPKR